METILSLLGIVASFFLLKYREKVGDTMGEAAWMAYVGGVYNFVIIVAILIFFWSLATLTGTSEIFFAPILWLLPGTRPGEEMDLLQ